MAHPPKAFRELARRFVCVRVTDMRGVDLDRYRFDFDLTFAILTMHPDGTIYHRFGGRDHTSPTRWIAMKPLLDVMRASLIRDAEHRRNGEPPPVRPRRTIEDYPTWKEFVGGRTLECAHCHQVGEHEVASAERAGGFDRTSIWRWPPPDRIGLVMDATDQTRVASVTPGSAIARSGIRANDRLVTVAGMRIASVTDIQAALNGLPSGKCAASIEFVRAGKQRAVRVVLEKGWKRGGPLTFSWRPLKWAMSPAPGFGGTDLKAERKKSLGIPVENYAFEIGYLVDWGRKAHRGRNARKAGLKVGDVVTSVNGKTDFRDQNHFHAWFRLRCRVGEVVEIGILRKGRPRVIRLPVVQ
ncbi:MAG TPA: PDZ domain-containing protein [Planctomycetes bacterium]|nr:PDZ domain-containing protein [Planctomycetota bacterium]